jgi:hypothetical protein
MGTRRVLEGVLEGYSTGYSMGYSMGYSDGVLDAVLDGVIELYSRGYSMGYYTVEAYLALDSIGLDWNGLDWNGMDSLCDSIHSSSEGRLQGTHMGTLSTHRGHSTGTRSRGTRAVLDGVLHAPVDQPAERRRRGRGGAAETDVPKNGGTRRLLGSTRIKEERRSQARGYSLWCSRGTRGAGRRRAVWACAWV